MKNAHKNRVREEATKENRSPRLRALVVSSLPQAAASIAGMLRKHPDLEATVVSGGSAQLQNALRDIDPDVLIFDWDEHEAAHSRTLDVFAGLEGMVPTVILAHDPSRSWIRQALKTGIRGVLPYGVSEDELAAATKAVASGLVALSPEFAEMISSTFSQADAREEFEVPLEPLTPREQEVLAMLSEGLLNKEIASRLQISEHTVKFHISSIMSKLGASSRTEAVTRGIRRGLVYI
jgi:DNA-binding NarL/FixJ family response regulator